MFDRHHSTLTRKPSLLYTAILAAAGEGPETALTGRRISTAENHARFATSRTPSLKQPQKRSQFEQT
jgi:hypothetical protein